MTDQLGPMPETQRALTDEEWLERLVDLHKVGGDCFAFCDKHDSLRVSVSEEQVQVPPARRHALAALCLYGQRFGFSQEDLSALHVVAALDQALGLPLGDPARSQLASLASRIQALLPPVSDQTND